MLDETGHRHQESMREHPSMKQVRNIDRLLRGTIKAVRYMDSTNKPRTTVVDIFMSGFPELTNVPVMSPKINHENGEEWTPDPGDGVLVAFVNGNFWEPVVIGYFPTVENLIQAKETDAPKGKRRYYRRCNKTTLLIDKDGNQTAHVEGNNTLTVTGNGSVTIQGNLTVTINGTANVTVNGNTTVTTPLTTVNGNVKVNGNITASGEVSDQNGTKSMSGMRSVFNGHTHKDNSHGAITNAPNQQM